MPEWLNLEWWRYAWGPLLAAGLIWLSTTWKTKSEARGGMDARLDGRLDRLLTAQVAEVENVRQQVRECEQRCDECEAEFERVMAAARTLEDFARDQRHEAHNRLAALAIAGGQSPPARLPDVPSLAGLLRISVA